MFKLACICLVCIITAAALLVSNPTASAISRNDSQVAVPSICSQGGPTGLRPCYPEFILRISKNYINNEGSDSFYDLFVYVRTCSVYYSGGQEYRVYSFLPYTGNVTFSIRQYDPGLPGQPSYNYTLNNAPWSSPITVTLYVTNGTTHRNVPSSYGRIAALMKAQPTDGSFGWSKDVHINRQTVWQLKSINSFWPTGTTGQRSYTGYNYIFDTSFNAEIGNRTKNYFHPSGKTPPTTDASAVMYFVKNNPYGWTIPAVPDTWGNPNNFWSNGQGNTLFWIKKSAAYERNHTGENWLLANGGEVYSPPLNWTNWQNEDYMTSTQPIWAEGYDQYQVPATNLADLRNYMLAPEYVSRGWGVYLNVTRAGQPWIWFAEANFHKDYQLGLTNLGRDIVQLKYVEAQAGILQVNLDPYDPYGGHREDWYLDSNGVVRVEGRSIGPLAWYGTGGWIKTRFPAYYDPDIFHREIIECPFYSMTANGG